VVAQFLPVVVLLKAAQALRTLYPKFERVSVPMTAGHVTAISSWVLLSTTAKVANYMLGIRFRGRREGD